jgi:hypothetical protein
MDHALQADTHGRGLARLTPFRPERDGEGMAGRREAGR